MAKQGPKTRTHPLVKQYVTKVLNPTIKQLAPLVGFGPLGRVYKASKLVKPVVKVKRPNVNRQEQNMADDNFGNIINMGPSNRQLQKQSARLIKKQTKQVEKKYKQPYHSFSKQFK